MNDAMRLSDAKHRAERVTDREIENIIEFIELNQKLNVPIGVIDVTWGGTPAAHLMRLSIF